MVKIEIVENLFEEIEKKFKREASKIFDLFDTLQENPLKGKIIGSAGSVLIKELKYKGFRFYFLVDGFRLKLLSEEELVDILMRFVRMSDKKHQKEAIEDIKHILKTIGPKGFK